ncbi:hypothetical protein [Curtobacterium sp. TXMA1]|uniref:hypothetical protein n=1 Tax=Curtobacterium sp. TXMA1 TaxID=2876939 RepID=UPI001CCE0E4C|nr:hypothetical protein [Curtobacterium sp. TXMA1]UBQ03037.1 hypothetical protein LCG91_02390 [Curtobacterium sp. TXMA1]
MTETTIRTKSLLTAIALIAVLPLGLTACSPSDPTADHTTAAAEGVGARWAACMREGGFEVQDASDEQITSGAFSMPSGVDEEAFGKRSDTCREQLGVHGADDAQKQEWARQYDAVASCIRENGYPDFPEQQEGSLDFGNYARAQEPRFDSAVQACMQEFAPDTRSAN